MHRNESDNMGADGLFPSQPPLAVITPEFVNSIQEELMYMVEQSGGAILGQANDTRTQLWDAIRSLTQGYDYVVNSQTEFINLFERVGANDYKIKDQYKSLLIRNIGSNYIVSALLTGGDTWGNLSTNNCTYIKCEEGSALDFENERGYLIVNTTKCKIENMHITGTGTVASAIPYCFYITGSGVKLYDCTASNRLSNSSMGVFYSPTSYPQSITHGCAVTDITSSGNITCFYRCWKLSSFYVNNIESTNGRIEVVDECNIVTSGYIYDVVVSGGGNPLSGIGGGKIVSCIYIENITNSGTGNCTGFITNDVLSACYAKNLDADSGDAYGYSDCDYLAACYATDIDSASGTAEGFNNCEYGSSLWTDEPLNSGNDWIDSSDAQITNKVSTPDVWT